MECKNYIINYLQANPPSTARDIANKSGWSETTIKKYICHLRQEGVKIETDLRYVKTKRGTMAHVAFYVLEGVMV
jgi:biotin operon repressor